MAKRKQNKQDFSHITPPKGAKIIPLTKGKYALVDEEDYERVNQYNWYCLKTQDNKEYACHKSASYFLMHRFIMGVTDIKIHVDHIFHNGLDNRKSQLRLCTPSENAQNKKNVSINSSSKYKGVNWDSSRNKWKAQISPPYQKNTFIGRFETEEEAARAYDAKAKELFGEFACLNFTEL